MANDDKHELIQYFDKTRDELLAAVKGLSEAQSNFQISLKGWSIAGIVEHVANVEDSVLARVLEELTSTTSSPAMKVHETDASLLNKATNRSVKLEAPEHLRPTGKPMATSLEQFLRNRKKIANFIKSTPLDLRHISTETRAFGVLDGHQRLLFLAGHSARHTEQILETKSNPNFPAQ